MITSVDEILQNDHLTRSDIIRLLSIDDPYESEKLFNRAKEIRKKFVGDKVYYRGLIEFSNICSKNCLYCGIRAGNTLVNRYDVSDNEIFEAVDYAWKNGYGSVVLQSGERKDSEFVHRVNRLIKTIIKVTNNEIAITLSCGEQSEETYKRWFESGAERYLLRIETSNNELYNNIHPRNSHHCFETRLWSLEVIKSIGYQTGTGVMIAIPGQSIEQLADDLIFFRHFGVDMVGMGPYIEHKDTPMFGWESETLSAKGKLELSLRTIAVLRIMLKNINIAAATALQSLDPTGREKGLIAGCNVIMPNITPKKYRKDYLLYDNKPCINEDVAQCNSCLLHRVELAGFEFARGEKGDSLHYHERQMRK